MTGILDHAGAESALRSCLTPELERWLLATEHEYPPEDAYVHPNGFWKLRIRGHSGDPWQLRLHFWPRNSGKGDIHDHGWAYASCVLQGAAKEDVYAEGTGERVTALSYAPASSAFALGEVRRETSLRLIETLVHKEGRLSGGEASRVHRFYPQNPDTELLTIVLTGARTVAHSTVFLPARGGTTQEVRPTPLTQEQVRAVLNMAHLRLATIVASQRG